MKHAFSYKAALGLFASLTLASCTGEGGGASMTAGEPVMRRLTQDQYRQTIADVFGADIKVAGRFEPEMRADGLLAVGTAQVSVTPSGFEQYNSMARNIASQVMDEAHRATLVSCTPASPKAADDACAAAFLGKVGRLLWRRPLTDAELKAHVAEAAEASKTLGGFYPGLEFALAGLMVAPEFLFRVEASPDGRRLDAYSKAARLSFLLWNTTPDDILLTAAEKGELNNKKGLEKQVNRLMASPRMEAGMRAFFADMLGFDLFDELSKDSVIYPAYSSRVALDAREQTLRTITHHLLTKNADYRELFTTKETFVTRALGAVYRIPVSEPTGWEPFAFAADDPRAGLLTQISFVAVHSHPGRSSATLRGKAVRELLMCQVVPAPPNNVNFTIVQDTSNPQFKTARARLLAHGTEAMCAGCHKIIDPIGLALEQFDGLGQYRPLENGAPIDTSGELNGVKFTDAATLGKALHDEPATTSCVVGNLQKYALGRKPGAEDKAWLDELQTSFAAGGYRFPDLLRRIAVSDDFYRMPAPPAPQAPTLASAISSKESAP